MDSDSMTHWWPLVKDLDNIHMPKTELVSFDIGASWAVSQIAIREALDAIGLPAFIRTDYTSNKHRWMYSCFLDDPGRLYEQISELVSFSILMDLPVKALAIREYIPMASGFAAFGGKMPVNPERRYFIRDGVVECHHPHWIEEAIREGTPKLVLADDGRRVLAALADMNAESPEEVELLAGYATTIAGVFSGYWSVDFCKARDGRWIFIDMATGDRSWHPACPHSQE